MSKNSQITQESNDAIETNFNGSNLNQQSSNLIHGKVVFVGTTGVGKTSLIAAFQKHDINQPPTVGANSITCSVDCNDEKVLLNIWDTAGQEEFKFLMPAFARGAEVAVVVFDMSRSSTFDCVAEWVTFFLETIPPSNILLVGNKIDLPIDVSEEVIFDYRTSKNILFFRTSAVSHEGITELFFQIAQCVQNTSQVHVLDNSNAVVFSNDSCLASPPKQNNNCC